jgi:hypothetical protein
MSTFREALLEFGQVHVSGNLQVGTLDDPIPGPELPTPRFEEEEEERGSQ